jgi:hypothetical protein
MRGDDADGRPRGGDPDAGKMPALHGLRHVDTVPAPAHPRCGSVRASLLYLCCAARRGRPLCLPFLKAAAGAIRMGRHRGLPLQLDRNAIAWGLPQYIQVAAAHGGIARVSRKATAGTDFSNAATGPTWSTPIHVAHVLIFCGRRQPLTAPACPPPTASRPPPPAGDTRTRIGEIGVTLF